MVELLDGPDQAEDALLDQVQEREARAPVALGVGHHEPQVRLDHPVLCSLIPALDPLGQVHLPGGRQEWPLRDVAQEHLERVTGGLRDVGKLNAAALLRSTKEIFDGALRYRVAHSSEDTPTAAKGQSDSLSAPE